MSPEILEQLQILFHFFLLGIVITLVYDVLRLLRYLIPHNHAVIAGEDLIFWIVTGFVVFDMFLRESNGSIRFFSIGGAVSGLFHKLTYPAEIQFHHRRPDPAFPLPPLLHTSLSLYIS